MFPDLLARDLLKRYQVATGCGKKDLVASGAKSDFICNSGEVHFMFGHHSVERIDLHARIHDCRCHRCDTQNSAHTSDRQG